ncbi:DUF1772 domain-containing protein [Kutzneria buriramensis]|nr:DUF1772 domain-containing protein [Kutzneria buriramensis]
MPSPVPVAKVCATDFLGGAMAEALQLVALLSTGLVCGVFFAIAVSVLPTLFALPPGQYVTVHRLLGKGYHPAMPLIVNAGTLADLALAVLRDGPARGLWALAFVAMVAVQGVSHLCNVPINRTLVGLDPDAIGPEWTDPRPKWRGYHLIRTAAAAVALLVTCLATVLPL